MAQTFQDIEKAAEYTPSVGANILNLLTGGIYGGVTGKTRQAQEAERLRQALRQEVFNERSQEREMQRALFRNRIQTLLEEGGEIPEGAKPENIDLIKEINKNRIKNLKDQIRGYTGAEPAENLPLGELRGQLARIQATGPQSEALKNQAATAEEQIKLFQGMGTVPTPLDTSKMSPAQKIAYANIYGSEFKSNLISERKKQDELDEENAFKQWNIISNDPKYISTSGDLKDQVALREEKREKLAEIYPRLNKAFRTDPSFINQAGLMKGINESDKKILRSRQDFYKQGNRLAESISDLVGDKDYNVISQMNFNQLQAWRKQMGDKYFQQNPNMAKIDKILQEFEGLVMGKRKELFGVTLSTGEQKSADRSFGSPEKANFLSSALNFMDSVFDPNFVKDNFTSLGVFVPDQYSDNLALLNSEYQNIRSKIKSPSLSGQKASNDTVTAPTAGTNAISQQLQSMKNRIDELKSRNSTNIVNPLNK